MMYTSLFHLHTLLNNGVFMLIFMIKKSITMDNGQKYPQSEQTNHLKEESD
jgi:hypothetical protein